MRITSKMHIFVNVNYQNDDWNWITNKLHIMYDDENIIEQTKQN